MRPKRKDHADFLDAICDVSMEKKDKCRNLQKKKKINRYFVIWICPTISNGINIFFKSYIYLFIF